MVEEIEVQEEELSNKLDSPPLDEPKLIAVLRLHFSNLAKEKEEAILGKVS